MPNRILTRAVRGLIRVLCAATTAAMAAPLVLPSAAHAVTLQQHRSLVEQFVSERHAEPLIADCAAHASFVVATLPGYATVEYDPDAMNNDHAKIEPWHGPFDNRKQKVDVTQVVTLDGIGKRHNGQADTIHIRCGYADGRMMAFDYAAPLPTVEASTKSTARSRNRSPSHAAANASSRKRTKKNAASSQSSAKRSANASSKAAAKPAAKASPTANKKTANAKRG